MAAKMYVSVMDRLISNLSSRALVKNSDKAKGKFNVAQVYKLLLQNGGGKQLLTRDGFFRSCARLKISPHVTQDEVSQMFCSPGSKWRWHCVFW